jgi:3D (Asp-Asp-Asp) domain-containing protein
MPLKRNLAILSVATLLLFVPILPVFAPTNSWVRAQENLGLVKAETPILPATPIIQDNSFIQISQTSQNKPELGVLETIQVMATGYSSSIWETDDTPHITASGSQTRDGVVASNLLPFGTKLRVPEYFGSKIFVVEDRMNSRMNDFQIDIWFPSSWQARQFGVKYTYIETLR